MKLYDAPESKRAGTVCFPTVRGKNSSGLGAGGSGPSSSGSKSLRSGNKVDSEAPRKALIVVLEELIGESRDAEKDE